MSKKLKKIVFRKYCIFIPTYRGRLGDRPDGKLVALVDQAT